MHRNYLYIQILITLILLGGCNSSDPIITDEDAYIGSIQEWQHQRVERLKSKTGWLNLAGLFWLVEGENSFGSDPSNDIVFPEKADAFCGTFTMNDGKVSLQVNKDVQITNGDTLVTILDLENDHSKHTTHLQQGELAWYIVKRGERYGIRMRDYKHPRIEALDHIPSYPIQTSYVVEATLKPFDQPRTFTVATPLEGFTEEYQCPGELHFKINQKNQVLFPFTSGKGYFLVFADETTGLETYGTGRFMYAMPDSTGRIILDFNKAYNPPCAFSPFATCPMPPRENFLPIAIEAGEKSVHFAYNSTPQGPPVESENIVFQLKDKELLEQVFDLLSEEGEATTSALMVKVGGFFRETPYVAHTLETEEEQLVINLREMDCTTFAENCLAISRTIKSEKHTFEQFTFELQMIRYRDGNIDGYPSRLHYFSDWIFNNQQKQRIKDMSKEIAQTPFPKKIDYMSTHPESYRQLKESAPLVETVAEQEKEISAREMFFIPENNLAEVESRLMDGDIVGITTGMEGIAISHVGILIHKAGRIHLMHASSLAEKVVISERTLEEYLLNSKSATGIMVARPL